VRNEQYRLRGRIVSPVFDDSLKVSIGPYFQLSRTKQGVRLVDTLSPYGNNDFGIVGLEGTVRYDTRASIEHGKANLELPFLENPAAGYPTSGIFFEMTGRISPPLIDVEKTYGSLRGSLAGYLSVGKDARATLALRVGGEETFGRTPFFDQAYIGGGRFFSGVTTNRGFRTRRFGGDSSVFGNADLRVFLVRLKIVVPGDLGVVGFADVGRVFINDESSDDWHPSGGGGLWFSPLVRTNTVSVSVAHSPEETLAYLRIGFHF